LHLLFFQKKKENNNIDDGDSGSESEAVCSLIENSKEVCIPAASREIYYSYFADWVAAQVVKNNVMEENCKEEERKAFLGKYMIMM